MTTASLSPIPRPLASVPPLMLVASASRVRGTTVDKFKQSRSSGGDGWQGEAWDLFDLIGEQHFLITVLAGRLSQARLFVGKRPTNPTEDIEPLDEPDHPAQEVLNSLRGSGAQLPNFLTRMGTNLLVAGDCWIVGEPIEADSTAEIEIANIAWSDSPAEIELANIAWSVKSVDEISFRDDGAVTIDEGAGAEHSTTYASTEEIILIRVWRSHPRRWWQADSATRSVLPILRELMGFTMMVGAQVDSRLAGAGLLLYPLEARRSLVAQASNTEPARALEDSPDRDPLLETLIEAMITPVSDRSDPSSLVPITAAIPAEHIDKVRHISFATPLDENASELQDRAIRRLALSQDCPPELLLGVGSLNHWGAWLVKEDVVTTHIEPPLALICDALTTQLLWPVLEQQGMAPEQVRQLVIWYDVGHMILRPDRAGDAKELYAAGAISAKAVRDSAGFDESDAPDEVDPVVQTALSMVQSAPSLAQDPGLVSLVAQLREIMTAKSADGLAEDIQQATEEAPTVEEVTPGTPESSSPDTSSEAMPE